MFDDFNLASTMLQVASGLAGLTLVSTGFIPFIAERTRGRYEAFVAQSRINALIRLTKLAFGAFALSVIFALVWCILLDMGINGRSVFISGIGSFVTFIAGFVLTTYIVLYFLEYNTTLNER